jgi:ATP-dependent exoDNAse (exonuclease V) alpha subunit
MTWVRFADDSGTSKKQRASNGSKQVEMVKAKEESQHSENQWNAAKNVMSDSVEFTLGLSRYSLVARFQRERIFCWRCNEREIHYPQ